MIEDQPQPQPQAGHEPRTYRGTNLEELLPRIRAELGPDAVVLRQRTGLSGGVGGFFQRRCVEVVARAGTARLNQYDTEPSAIVAPPPPPSAVAPDAALADGLRSPAIQEIIRQAGPFATQLQTAGHLAAAAGYVPVPLPYAPPPDPAPAPAVADVGRDDRWFTTEPSAAALPAFEPVALRPFVAEAPVAAPAFAPPPPVPPAPLHPERAPSPVFGELALPDASPRTGAAAGHERTLVAAGLRPDLAAELVSETISHAVPFGSTRALKRLLRQGLAHRIVLAAPAGAGGRTIALVGAGGTGKTLTAARLAAAYTAGSDLGVEVLALGSDGGAELGALLAPAGVAVGDARAWSAEPTLPNRVLTILDTPAISPGSETDIRTLAAELERVGPCEVHVAVPATASAPAVRRLLEALAPLAPHAVVLTHLDEVGHAGPVLDALIDLGVGISFCGEGTGLGGLTPADPAALATAVLA